MAFWTRYQKGLARDFELNDHSSLNIWIAFVIGIPFHPTEESAYHFSFSEYNLSLTPKICISFVSGNRRAIHGSPFSKLKFGIFVLTWSVCFHSILPFNGFPELPLSASTHSRLR
jgi:hypothetical protein